MKETSLALHQVKAIIVFWREEETPRGLELQKKHLDQKLEQMDFKPMKEEIGVTDEDFKNNEQWAKELFEDDLHIYYWDDIMKIGADPAGIMTTDIFGNEVRGPPPGNRSDDSKKNEKFERTMTFEEMDAEVKKRCRYLFWRGRGPKMGQGRAGGLVGGPTACSLSCSPVA